MGSVPERNDIVSRIERLERLVSDLTRPDVDPAPAPPADAFEALTEQPIEEESP